MKRKKYYGWDDKKQGEKVIPHLRPLHCGLDEKKEEKVGWNNSNIWERATSVFINVLRGLATQIKYEMKKIFREETKCLELSRRNKSSLGYGKILIYKLYTNSKFPNWKF